MCLTRTRCTTSPHAAELNAAEVLKSFGFTDAKATTGGADGGIDVRASRALAQVKWRGGVAGRPALQQLVGAAAGETGKALFFFSASGYSQQAVQYADQHDIGLFTYDPLGRVEAVNLAASGMRRGNGTPLPDPKTTYVELVQSVPTAPKAMPPEQVWRICSGMAHGKGGAFQVVSARANAKSDGSTETVDYTLNLHALMACIGVGINALQQATELFDCRRTLASGLPE